MNSDYPLARFGGRVQGRLLAVLAFSLIALCGCTASRTPATDEQGRKWIIECNDSEYSRDNTGVLFNGAECTAMLVRERM